MGYLMHFKDVARALEGTGAQLMEVRAPVVSMSKKVFAYDGSDDCQALALKIEFFHGADHIRRKLRGMKLLVMSCDDHGDRKMVRYVEWKPIASLGSVLELAKQHLTPHSNLGSTTSAISMPAPKYSIGQRVKRECLADPFYRRTLLRSEIRELRVVVERMKNRGRMLGRGGFDDNTAGGRFHPGHKAKIREIMAMFDNAEAIEICGIVSFGAQANVHISNQCYLVSGTGWSGVDWHYKLLLRYFTDEGNKVCYMPGSLMISESWIRVEND